MIAAASVRFGTDPHVEVRLHDLEISLPDDRFDVVVSSFAIHHCADSRNRSLYSEIYDRLGSGGVFCNLERVSSPTDALHFKFLNIP